VKKTPRQQTRQHAFAVLPLPRGAEKKARSMETCKAKEKEQGEKNLN